MKLYTDFPVYNDLRILHIELLKEKRNVSKLYRYTDLEKILDQLIDLMADVYLASISYQDDKKKLIGEMRKKFVAVIVRLRALNEIGEVSNKWYSSQIIKIDSISKQLQLWYRSV